jgi:translation initiation factor 1A
MGKNQKGGKGHKRCKNNNAKTDKKLEFKDEGELQQYGVVVTVLGGCRFTIAYMNNNSLTEKLGVICGRMRKRVFIKRGDVVIISEREFEKHKVDIVHKYQDHEAILLKKYKELDGLETVINQTSGKFNGKDNNEADILFDLDSDIEFDDE